MLQRCIPPPGSSIGNPLSFFTLCTWKGAPLPCTLSVVLVTKSYISLVRRPSLLVVLPSYQCTTRTKDYLIYLFQSFPNNVQLRDVTWRSVARRNVTSRVVVLPNWLPKVKFYQNYLNKTPKATFHTVFKLVDKYISTPFYISKFNLFICERTIKLRSSAAKERIKKQ